MAFDPISAGFDFVGKVIDKLFPDKTKADEIKAQLKTLDLSQEFQLTMGQLLINQEEAKHESIFVAGWRPFIGWVCGVAMAYYYILQPFLIWIFDVYGIDSSMPALNSGELMTVLLGMLGLGAMRSFDKSKNGGGKQG
jgi:hypothetical protein